ncbi:MAG: insulinase family protein [Clostridiales bacterium]|nr:insulinase family protein [Clostridiales bacterium]
MAELINYPCGLRLIVENNPFVRSVAASVWVNTGSAMENKENNGISHYIEHVLFKGTDKLSAFDIANAFESRGAAVNAFTSKEATCFYFKSIDSDTEKCFSTLSELFFHSVFAQNELDSERNVVIEEINMEDDSPEDICYDLLAKALYGEHPLGMSVLGPRENVKRFNKPDILEYMGNQYCAQSIVIAFVGNIDAKEADRIVRTHFMPFVNQKTQKSKAKQPHFEITTKSFIKDFKQTNLMLGYPSVSLGDPSSTVQGLLNVILGGCMGSRLFQNIREKKGLAYSVYSSPSRHSNCGSFNIALNINAQNTARVLDGVFEELDAITTGGITAAELDMAKAQLKSTMIFGQENIQTIMLSLGKSLLLSNEVFDIDEKLREIEAVTVDEVNRFALNTFKQTPALAYVGSDSRVNLEQYTRR